MYVSVVLLMLLLYLWQNGDGTGDKQLNMLRSELKSVLTQQQHVGEDVHCSLMLLLLLL